MTLSDVSDAALGPPGQDPDRALWDDALLAAALIAVDPAGLGGVWLRGRAGPTRALWLDRLRAMWPAPERRLPAHIGPDRLLGGLDLAPTLAGGAPVFADGLLAEIDGGRLIAPMAERLSPAAVGPLAEALDARRVPAGETTAVDRQARFALIALDEAVQPDPTADRAEEPEPGLSPALADRLALWIRTPDAGAAELARRADAPARAPDAIAAATARLPEVTLSEAAAAALIEAADRLGAPAGRADLFAARAARAAAALAGRLEVAAEDLAVAGRLTLGPRATRDPGAAPPAQDDAPPPPEPGQGPEPDIDPSTAEDAPPPADNPPADPERAEPPDPAEIDAARDTIVAAAAARLPPGLLDLSGGAPSRRGGAAGVAGRKRRGSGRGRAIGSEPGRPGGGVRLDLLATLRAAAPWSRLRGAAPGDPRPPIRLEDLRVARVERPAETLIIFAVDASGSTALGRLAEAKGAVERLLAESYARRDQVALIAFRGDSAELRLPPTRSLTRAKRLLAGLPGGGGTPLALGLDQARALGEQARRAGRDPILVILTDGQANVARDGAGGRARAGEDAAASARAIRAAGLPALVIDAAQRRPGARGAPPALGLAETMGARYAPLPRADAGAVAAAVRAVR